MQYALKLVVSAGLVTVAVIVFITGISAAFLYVQPYFANKQMEITRNTNSYVTSKQAAVRELYTQYLDLQTQMASLSRNPANAPLVDAMKNQANGIIRQMRQEADTIPVDVPSDVNRFLATVSAR